MLLKCKLKVNFFHKFRFKTCCFCTGFTDCVNPSSGLCVAIGLNKVGIVIDRQWLCGKF